MMGRFPLIFSFAASLLVLSSGMVAANDKAVIVLDASGSMWGRIEDKTKIEVARETLGQVLKTVPDTLDLGLVVYGHRQKGACSDIQEIVAPAPGTREAITQAVSDLNPKGKTPIADSVKMAAESLKYTEDKATVIVITDGIETCNADPCALASELEKTGVDFTAHVIGFGLSEEEGRKVACLAENTGGKYLQAGNADELSGALVETVAAAPEPEPEPVFEIGEGMEAGIDRPGHDYHSFFMDEPKPAMCQSECAGDNKCVAWTFVKPGIQGENAKCWLKSPAPEKVENDCCISGVVVKAENNVTIHAVLAEGAAEYDLNGRWDFYRMNGDQPEKEAIEGGYGTTFTVTLKPGRYLLSYNKDMVTAETVVDVKEGEVIDRELVLNAGVLTARVVPEEGGEVDGQGRFDIEANGADGGGYGEGTFVVPAGDIHLTARLGSAGAEADLKLAAGETIEHTIVAGVGVLIVNAVYAEGGPAVESGEMRVDIFSAKKALDGTRKDFGGGYGPGDQYKLPPDEYVVRVRLGMAVAELPVTVTGGESTEAVVNVNAGVLSVSAPGAYRIEVFSAKPDLQGKREEFAGNYGEELQVTLPPGEYAAVALAQGGEVIKEVAVTVKAAERNEAIIQ